MEIETSRVKPFKELLEVLNVLEDRHIFHVNETGIEVNTMDPSYVALICFKLPREYFEAFKVNESDKFTLDLSVMKKALNKTYKNDSLKLEYSYKLKESKKDENSTPVLEKNNEELKLTLYGGVSDVKRVKTIPLPETMEEELPMPKVFFKSKTRILLSTFKTIIDDMQSEHISIESNFDEIVFKSDTDLFKERTPIPKHSDSILRHEVEEISKVTYTKSYLQSLLKKANKVSEVATLSFSNDMPLMLDIEIPQGSLKFYLAPCIGV